MRLATLRVVAAIICVGSFVVVSTPGALAQAEESSTYQEHLDRGGYLLRLARYYDAMQEYRLAARTTRGLSDYACQAALADAAQRAGHVGVALVAMERAIELTDDQRVVDIAAGLAPSAAHGGDSEAAERSQLRAETGERRVLHVAIA